MTATVEPVITAPRLRKREGQTSEDRALLIKEVVEDRKAESVELLDLRGRSLLSDFFIICTGTSSVQIRAIANAILERVDEGDLPKPRIEGQQVGEWILMDFADVVVHVMDEASRARYKLEDFWSQTQPKGALLPLEGEEDEDDDEEFDEDEESEEGDELDEEEEFDEEDDDFDDEEFEDDEEDLEELDEDDEDEEIAVFVEADKPVPPVKDADEGLEPDPVVEAMEKVNRAAEGHS